MGYLDTPSPIREAPQQTIEALRAAAEPLPDPADVEAFGAFFDRFGDARVVLLGEATHGTAEFYRARGAITRRLIERHGFTTIAVEADWPDAARIDDYVRHQAPRPRRGDVFARFPTWIWRNLELLEYRAIVGQSTMASIRAGASPLAESSHPNGEPRTTASSHFSPFRPGCLRPHCGSSAHMTSVQTWEARWAA